MYFGRKMLRLLKERKKFILGLEGEMFVGEELNQLMLDACRVFHDIEFPYGNIDHVVVSRSGVFSVNTKMLGKPTQGEDKAKVTVDHEQNVLRLPDRAASLPVNQLEAEAKWLAQYLTSAVATEITVEPMLALPGWFIERRGRGPVCVLNPRNAKKFFVRSRTVLSPEQVQQVAHQLEQLCRNVSPSYQEPNEWKASG